MDVSYSVFYTSLTTDKHNEKHKFKNDVEHLADAINGMADISELVNVWGVFVPSNEVGGWELC